MSLQSSVQAGWLRSVRKAGLALARHWPWPVAARITTGRRMYVDLRSPVGRAIYMKGEFDPKVFEPLAARLQPGGLFVDVGANVGFYSLRALDVVGANGAVHAFEIDPRPLRCLRKTIARSSLKNVHLHEQAVGDRHGPAILVQREDCGHSSVATEGEGVRVPMITLDAWREKHPGGSVQAIKMDIEGGELRALRGATELLRRERPLLVCEVVVDEQDRRHSDTQALFGLLKATNYRWQWVEGCNDPTLMAE
ncbi:MAG: FkbM family methyltransferase [Verrucomicrobiae bacterium]|nr:FkbM family methyltransferase [Verrucomicrobiae bacterium]